MPRCENQTITEETWDSGVVVTRASCGNNAKPPNNSGLEERADPCYREDRDGMRDCFDVLTDARLKLPTQWQLAFSVLVQFSWSSEKKLVLTLGY